MMMVGIMKIGLANEEGTIPAQAGFAEQVGAAAAALKSFLTRIIPSGKSEPWLSGYNAFYDGVKANPHAAGSDPHKEWELGSQAFEQDFEW